MKACCVRTINTVECVSMKKSKSNVAFARTRSLHYLSGNTARMATSLFALSLSSL
jgi:hypothetical protein